MGPLYSLIESWYCWMERHNVAMDKSLPTTDRFYAIKSSEHLITKRYEYIKEIDEIFTCLEKKN